MIKYLFIVYILLVSFGCKHEISDKLDGQKPLIKDYSSIENSLHQDDSTKTSHSLIERIKFHKVPGVSVAIFEDGNITFRNEYGVRDSDSKEKVDSLTKFQAASIGKTVTAIGILKLVETNNLDIDEDVNQYLKSWKVDYTRFSDSSKVTIRRLLSHTSGINMNEIKGYKKKDTIPSTVEILNGYGNTDKIKLDTIPGTGFYYSGGGYTVLQAMIEDISKMSFQKYFENEVFKPLKMDHSTFNQFPSGNVSSAHDQDGNPHPEDWIIYPELAAAGLWTTPSDLANLCIAIDNSYSGKDNSFLSSETAKEMMKPVTKWSAGEFGLGIMLRGTDENEFYFHTGSNPGGFRSMMIDLPKKKTGIVVLTNSDNGTSLYNEIVTSFFKLNNVEL